MLKKKKAEAKKEMRTVKIQGRQAERLAILNHRRGQLQDQQAKILLEMEKVKGGIDALLDIQAGPEENAITYDFKTCEVTLEVKPKEEKK